MTEETLKVILDILHDKFNLDDPDLVLFVIEYEKRTERCQEDWSNRQKDRVNIRNDEDGDIILVLEKLEEE